MNYKESFQFLDYCENCPLYRECKRQQEYMNRLILRISKDLETDKK